MVAQALAQAKIIGGCRFGTGYWLEGVIQTSVTRQRPSSNRALIRIFWP